MKQRKKILTGLLIFIIFSFILAAQVCSDNTGMINELGFVVEALLEDFAPKTNITATEVEWDVYKPNYYATEALGMILFWEGPVNITFEGVEDLTSIEFPEKSIKVWYAFTSQEPVSVQEPFIEGYVIEGSEEISLVTEKYSLVWQSPQELNDYSLPLLPDEGNITSTRINMWIKIKVDFSARGGNYEDKDGFNITITAKP